MCDILPTDRHVVHFVAFLEPVSRVSTCVLRNGSCQLLCCAPYKSACGMTLGRISVMVTRSI